jgi:flagellar motility protein MotE (MotC chaperone)
VQKNHEEIPPQGEPVAGGGAETIDLNYLIKKKAELEREEERLEKERAELMTIKEDLNNKIATLTQLRNEMRAMMDRRQAAEGQRIKKLIKAYSAMKPQKAANLIEKLEIGFAIELLSNMKGEVVGEILSFVDTEKGARISEALGKKR